MIGKAPVSAVPKNGDENYVPTSGAARRASILLNGAPESEPDDVPADMSHGSIDSTIIKARVLALSPGKRSALRHVKKNVALRDQDASRPQTAPSLQATAIARHQLLHKKSKVVDLKRASVASEHSIDSDPEPVTDQEQIQTVPVVVIPQRSPNRNLRRPDSRTSSSSLVPGSAASQAHLVTDELGYFDLPSRSKKAVERPSQVWSDVRDQAGHLVLPAMALPAAPFLPFQNGNESRATLATSLATSTSSRATAQSLQMLSTPRTTNARLSERQHSASSTPYTHLSPSTTVEGLEVSEATAVSIYPHNLSSLLVVQQHSRPVSHEDGDDEPDVQSRAPRTPPRKSTRLTQVDSPLKNPRKPPKPPAVQIIPPTPDILSPTRPEHNPLGGSGKALALVKRALSNRRYSDSFISPFARFRTKDQGPYRLGVGGGSHDPDSRLSPFWRPRGFWDDLEIDDDEVQDEFLGRGRVGLFEQHPAAPGPRSAAVSRGQRDVTSAADRRHPRSHSPASSAASIGIRSDRGLSSSSHGGRRRGRTISGLGIRIEFIGWKSMQRRLRRTNASERARERFKGTISTPTAIDPASLVSIRGSERKMHMMTRHDTT
ncbi:MAG: hypothetical protein M1826_007663 [Phylliscum demangeonii]|nr:MAG: hypothetical protein M1826_007663 [Phylliscum demangeonii]